MQWHLIGMYAPAFFAGALINRLGLPRVLGLGMALNAACSLIAMQSTSLAAFHAALFCLGVGWNFMFVGGTTLLAQSYRPAERARVQGAAEMLRYATTALATLAAGPALARMGWETLNAAMLPIVGLAALTFMTASNSMMQLTTERTMRGRVLALRIAVVMGGTPIGAPLVGWVVDRFGARWALGVGALAGLAAAAVAITYLVRHRRLRFSMAGGRPRLSIHPTPADVTTVRVAAGERVT